MQAAPFVVGAGVGLFVTDELPLPLPLPLALWVDGAVGALVGALVGAFVGAAHEASEVRHVELLLARSVKRTAARILYIEDRDYASVFRLS